MRLIAHQLCLNIMEN